MKSLKTPLLVLAVLSAVTTMVAAYLKLIHSNSLDTFLTIAVVMYGVLFVFALLDILSSRAYSAKEKVLWIIVVLFGNALGVLLYILIGNKQEGIVV